MPDSARLTPRPTIRQLPPDAVNRIAAGEVVERPAAAVKELVENALDAGARAISVTIEGGGLKRMIIEDDGCGMSGAEILMALERHATSKLAPGEDGRIDLLNIHTMGFRGEALPSIASVSRMTLTSKAEGEDASEVFVEAGRIEGPKPAAWTGRGETGTRIEVRDLFHATPARLKFMKSERAETMAVTDAVKRLAMANADVSISLESNGRNVFRYAAHQATPEGDLERLGSIMGREFRENALAIEAEREGVTLSGFAGLPTLNRGNAQYQFLFVNGRPVKDRMLTGVIRAAYQDFLARDRHPMAALFVDCDPELVDVNVHPAKTEVRFRDAGNVRGLIIGTLRHTLAAAGHRASTTVAGYALGKMQGEDRLKDQPLPQPSVWDRSSLFRDSYGSPPPRPQAPSQPMPVWAAPQAPASGFSEDSARYDAPSARFEPQPEPSQHDFPLGVARAQLHETYVVAQTRDGIVIVDQHAAHERLVYEQMKAQMAADGVKRQALLIPEVVELTEDEAARVIDRADELAEMGLEIEAFGAGAVCVRATPALFGNMDAAGLIKDLADDFAEYEEGLALKERFEDIMGNMACKGGAVRAGRRLNADEMNALLRQMEATPYSGQCNHGRPTYVELKLADIEKLFGRR
ncbi:DNA mismatch repair endonuclease MutL [Henriciella barbarensis]|uniref:DNA mismatch repair protein MutL n=1 Tax=Henriciella barbarensis TaxID=86342 RepID=A0A399QRA6_9PROT|nr:DNA mismatch repair endonuclease MutL [Henriciella barbarensis]RIJ21343.1 DNA mismatch repair endonuclease MutL [Henriciella barbarensis]